MLPPADFDSRLRSLAEVVIRIGVNLQPGQQLLVTDPYDLQGVHPDSQTQALSLFQVAERTPRIVVAEPDRLRALLESDDLRRYETLVEDHIRRLHHHLKSGGAFVFLTGSAPQLLAGIPAERLARFDAVKWRHLGPLIQTLLRGATQWTLAPAPTAMWAEAAGVDLPTLWNTVFAALRIGTPDHDPIADWQQHLAALARQRDQLNAARYRRIRYTGPGTDLALALPRSHRWCTAQLTTRRGVNHFTNLPTEEIFTAPHRRSAHGTVRVDRPVTIAGNRVDGIELEFRAGRVVGAVAREGADILQAFLATDPGAARLGEVAIVPDRDRLSWAGRAHHNILLDENSAPHIALGDAYRFCSRAWFPLALNSSRIHLDLPLDARVELT